jgi:hypothetical protein
MKSNGFNLFDQAFAVAEQKKTEKIEKSTRKTPIYLIVGLDFGTAFTKCMVRDYNYRRAAPLAFTVDGESTFLIPSKLAWHAGTLSHPLDGLAKGIMTLDFLKMALASAAAGKGSDWLDGLVRRLGIDGSQRQVETLQALVVYYIHRVLLDVDRYIRDKWLDFGQLEGDTIYFNMAVPVAQATDKAIIDAFSQCLNAAVSILNSKAMIPATLSGCIAAFEKHKDRQIPECSLMPEVTANVQSYVRDRGGRQGLYLFADVGAGTVDYSVFIYYDVRGEEMLTYPHAAVEHLGSSQLEIRAFLRLQSDLMEQLRLLKEGLTRDGESSVNLPEALESIRSDMSGEIVVATTRVIGYARRKIRRQQFQTMEILYGGGGCCQEPYENGIETAFDPRWGLTPVSQPLPVPKDVDWPNGDGATLFKRFSVAYGLSLLPTDHQVQHFPDEIGEFDPAEDHQRRDIPSAPTKDEV